MARLSLDCLSEQTLACIQGICEGMPIMWKLPHAKRKGPEYSGKSKAHNIQLKSHLGWEAFHEGFWRCVLYRQLRGHRARYTHDGSIENMAKVAALQSFKPFKEFGSSMTVAEIGGTYDWGEHQLLASQWLQCHRELLGKFRESAGSLKRHAEDGCTNLLTCSNSNWQPRQMVLWIVCKVCLCQA